MSLQVWLPLNGDLTNQGLSGNLAVTNSGTTVDNSGKIGKCYIASASTNSISCTGINLFNLFSGTVKYSFSCWAKSVMRSGWVVKLGTSNNIGLWFGLNDSRWIWNDSDSGKRITTVANSEDTTNWHHITIVVDKTTISSIKYKFYFDGELTVDTTSDGSSKTQPTGDSIIIYPYYGQIQDIRLYDHCLSIQEVKKLAQGLILHYPLSSPSDVLVPPGYQQLEYLESTGTQYIDTGKVPQDTYEYRFKYALTAFDVYKGPFSAYSAEAANTVRIVPNNGSNADVFIYFNSKASGGALTVTGLTSAVNQIVEGLLSKKSYYLKNITSNIVKSNSSATDLFPTKGTTITGNMCLFGISGYISQSRIYYFDTYNNGVCIQKLVPAKRLSDNVLGMYDVITKTFFTNADTGTFTAGPNAPVSNPVYDISGFKNHGTVVGNLTAVADTPRYKTAIYGNSSSLIKLQESSFELIDPTQFSISFWIKGTTNGYPVVFTHTDLGYFRAWINGDKFYFRDSDSGTSNGTPKNVSIGTWRDGQWHHIVISYNSTKVSSFNNGGYVVQDLAVAGTYMTKFNRIGIFGNSDSGTYIYDGTISDFRLYVTALTEDDAIELYSLGHV